MKLFQTIFWAVLSALVISGCATDATHNDGEEAVDQSKLGVVLLYAEKEPDSPQNGLRMFVNKEFLRIDDLSAPNGFILFERKTRTIYNILSDEKTVSVIAPKPVLVAPPMPIAITEEKSDSALVIRGMDTSNGFHYKFFANGAACYNVVVAENFLPDVVQAFVEFRTVLAGEHATALGNLPPERLDACDLALNIFYPAHHLQFGFPLREWNDKGYSKFLREVQYGIVIDPKMLTVPANYARYPFGVKPH